VAVLDPDLQTPCERAAEKARLESTSDDDVLLVGAYIPQCDKRGNYEPTQFHPSNGYSWCVDEHGREINGTATPPGQPDPDCSQYEGSLF